MAKFLVIVESPAKAKTIKKYLGADYDVLASYGHVRDLVAKEGAVDTEKDFAMKYQLIEKNAKHVAEIEKAVKKVDGVLLAPDPDREGEAIAWHISEILSAHKALKNKTVKRVVFHEITQTAIKAAIEKPREILMDLVNAQQARRALDFLVGFTLSPLLWKKIRRGLSAGRVQSPALRMIVERELEIEKFIKQEYWSVTAECLKEQLFTAKLNKYQGEKLEQFSIVDEVRAGDVKAELLRLAKGKLTVGLVEKKQRKRNPSPPFITSTLQQEAARKLGFTASRTMSVAQQLYEGIDVGGGAVGLITYMRTDSVNMAQEALVEVREFIAQKYGADQVPPEARLFKTKSKNAQEAHEAIRPTSVHRTPDEVKAFLTPEQAKLYQLIWKRTVACQMIHATIDTVAADLHCGSDKNIFRANGSVITSPGFIAVYEESVDDAKVDEEDRRLPPLKEGDVVELGDIHALQHFTEPPPRYSEASLVKALEEKGIGRPSTYASIISTLQARDYVILETKRFYPTDVGRVVAKFLINYFEKYVDYGFTANLEDDLDNVADGTKDWKTLMHDFWGPFRALIGTIETTVDRKAVTQEAMDEKCPECSKPLSSRLGKNGTFIGCTGYPECKYTRNVSGEQSTAPEIVPDRKCPKCESDLLTRHGPFGKFIGCTSYPKCKFIESLQQAQETAVACPTCNKNKLVKKRSKRGKFFYGCGGYPDCKYAVWNEPVAEECPNCHWPMLTIKVTKKFGSQKVCPQEKCGYVADLEKDGAE